MKKCLVSLLAFLIGQALFAFDMPSEWVFGARSDDAAFDHLEGAGGVE